MLQLAAHETGSISSSSFRRLRSADLAQNPAAAPADQTAQAARTRVSTFRDDRRRWLGL